MVDDTPNMVDARSFDVTQDDARDWAVVREARLLPPRATP